MTDEHTSPEEPEDLEVTAEEARDVKGGEGQATGKRKHADITIVKQVDVSTPTL